MNNKQLLGRIIQSTSGQKKYFIYSIIFAILSVTTTLMQPFVIGKAIDYIIAKDNINIQKILLYIVIFGAITLINFVCNWLVSYSTNKLSFDTTTALRNQVFEHFNKVPISKIDSSSQGDLLARVGTDIENISTGLLQGFTQLLTGIITILGTLGLMLYINFWISLIVIVLTPLSFVVASVIAKGVHKYFTAQAKEQGLLLGYASESIDNIKTIKLYDHQQPTQQGFQKINSQLYDVGLNAQIYSSLINPCTRFVNNIVYAIVGTVGAILGLTQGLISAGGLTTFLIYSGQYTKPFNEISGVVAELQSALASAKRVYDFLDSPIELDGTQTIVDCNGEVSFNNVSFAYSADKPLINNLNLDIKKGQKVAIVGPTGCGKTTLINLLMRFYDVNSGSITVSGYDINEVKRTSLRSNFAMVLQDTWLFDGTIRDNIAFGKQDATCEEIKQASIESGADHFISALADGYDTIIYNNGSNLSQGQRQLLAITRVLLINPPILILDEATSNIDTRTEQRISMAFDQLQYGKTSFVVAHRLSTIRDAHLILVMKDGDIIEQGDHNQLMAKNGFYSQLYYSQFATSE